MIAVIWALAEEGQGAQIKQRKCFKPDHLASVFLAILRCIPGGLVFLLWVIQISEVEAPSRSVMSTLFCIPSPPGIGDSGEWILRNQTFPCYH